VKGLFRSLRFRFVVSHLAVITVGAVVLLIMGNAVGPSFLDQHLDDMANTFGAMPEGMRGQLEEGFASAFASALLVAVSVSVAIAFLAAAFAAGRVLRPLEAVRTAARRLASGSYGERVPEPKESELAALAADVNALAEALDSVEERRVRLISEVAHELRTPLSTIQGYMEGLIDGVFEPSDVIFHASAKEAARLKRLAADLSTLSRALEGTISLDVQPVDLVALAREVAFRLRPQFEDQGVLLEVDDSHGLVVDGDHDRLAQVFTNLIGNALSATPTGGSVRVVPRRLRDHAVLEIRDTGKGIAPEQLDLIFERFYRADSARSGGTGIGLTIARSILRLHGGDVVASSGGVGHGAAFTVTVPLRKSR
jgi:signal transduction histidine kinase